MTRDAAERFLGEMGGFIRENSENKEDTDNATTLRCVAPGVQSNSTGMTEENL